VYARRKEHQQRVLKQSAYIAEEAGQRKECSDIHLNAGTADADVETDTKTDKMTVSQQSNYLFLALWVSQK
jgi:hypothetical protein